MKVYINEGSFGFDFSLLKKIEIIANSKFSGIGIWQEKLDILIKNNETDVEAVRDILTINNIEVIEINFLKKLFTHNYDDADLQQEIDQAIYYANYFGSRIITAATFGDNLNPTIYLNNIINLADKLARHNISLAIEFLPWTEIPSISKLYEIINVVNKKNIGILLDTYHFFMGDSNLDLLKKIPPEKIFLIHCNDLDINSSEFLGLSLLEITRGYRVAPGLGSFPLEIFFKTLREMAVSAPVSLEVLNKDSSSEHHINTILESYNKTTQLIRSEEL